MPKRLHQEERDMGVPGGSEPAAHDSLLGGPDNPAAARATAEREERERLEAMAQQQGRGAGPHDQAPGGAHHRRATDMPGRPAQEPTPDSRDDEVGAGAAAVAIGVGAALVKAELIPGILIGAGAVLLGKMFPEIGSLMRPAMKTVLRTGMAVTDKARAMGAEASEQMQELVAELRAERERDSGEARATPHSRPSTPDERDLHDPAPAH